ncbi:MAG: hypothetical protein Ct9H90mP6_09890 [Gammaproteobacteria bacterium]|nr:MAG: hypothetical protein Ct9H90mP6_09890 [Gammaproteobacteria bacterium]
MDYYDPKTVFSSIDFQEGIVSETTAILFGIFLN